MGEMNSGRWQQVKERFAAAEELSVEERRSFLRQACRNDPELEVYIESLLVSRDEADSFLERFTGDIPKPKSPAAGGTIPWQVLEDLFSKGLHANEEQRSDCCRNCPQKLLLLFAYSGPLRTTPISPNISPHLHREIDWKI